MALPSVGLRRGCQSAAHPRRTTCLEGGRLANEVCWVVHRSLHVPRGANTATAGPCDDVVVEAAEGGKEREVMYCRTGVAGDAGSRETT
jgi:hypothetical protein